MLMVVRGSPDSTSAGKKFPTREHDENSVALMSIARLPDRPRHETTRPRESAMDMLVLAAHLSGNGFRLQQAGQSASLLVLALLLIAFVVAALEAASA